MPVERLEGDADLVTEVGTYRVGYEVQLRREVAGDTLGWGRLWLRNGAPLPLEYGDRARLVTAALRLDVCASRERGGALIVSVRGAMGRVGL